MRRVAEHLAAGEKQLAAGVEDVIGQGHAQAQRAGGEGDEF